jgi:hypothetical protein
MINRINCDEGCVGWMGVATGEDDGDMRDGASYKILLRCNCVNMARQFFTDIINTVLYEVSDIIVIDPMRSSE